jgi:hypothetical protein
MESSLQLLISLWPVFVGFITLVIVLAKMHSSIEVLRDKVKTLFQLYNQWIESDKQRKK